MLPISSRIGTGLLFAAAIAGVSGSACACDSAQAAYISSVCIMAGPPLRLEGLHVADGSSLPFNQNVALFALIGYSYGGTQGQSVKLPDLRGRFVLGAGTSDYGVTYAAGSKGGTATVTLTSNQMPAHVHTMNGRAGAGVSGNVDLSNVTAVATVDLPFTADASKLVLNGTNANATTTTPGGAALAIPVSPAGKIYGATAPATPMAAGSITGTLKGTINGTVPVNLKGQGVTTVQMSGTTDVAGAGQPVSIMPPYVAMTYYIVTQGIFPTQY